MDHLPNDPMMLVSSVNMLLRDDEFDWTMPNSSSRAHLSLLVLKWLSLQTSRAILTRRFTPNTLQT